MSPKHQNLDGIPAPKLKPPEATFVVRAAGALLLKGRDEVSVGRCREVAQAELARYIESLWG